MACQKRSYLSAALLLAVVSASCGGDNLGERGLASRETDVTSASSSSPSDTASGIAAEAPSRSVPEATCTYLGTDPNYGYMHVELTFTNLLGNVGDLKATYALRDGGGTRVFTGTAGGLDIQDIHFPSEGERFRLDVDTREEPPLGLVAVDTGCSVLGIEEGIDIGGYERATDADTCDVVGTDPRNGPEVTISVTSPYSNTTGVQLWWALRGPGGVRFDTSTKVVDLVSAGERLRFTENSLTGPVPEWATGEVTCDVVGFWDHGN